MEPDGVADSYDNCTRRFKRRNFDALGSLIVGNEGRDIYQHILYFGIQAKKGKLHAAGVTKTGNASMAEIYNQTLMTLAHGVFDPEINCRVLVDHASIVAGGEITKAARNWLGNALDAAKRSQIKFMDRNDTLNLYVATSLPVPLGALPTPPDAWSTSGDLPF